MTSPKSIRIPLLVIIGCALVGMWASGTLLVGHDGSWDTTHSGVASILGLCESIRLPGASCSEVVGSKWGSIDFTLGGKSYLVPTSFLGVSYFGAIAIWFGVLGFLRAGSRRLWGYSIWGIAGGVVVSAALVALMFGELGHWCPLCGVAHAANIVIFVATIFLWRGASVAQIAQHELNDPRKRRSMTRRTIAVATAAIVGMTVLSWFYYDAMRSAKRQWHKVIAYRELIDQMRSDPKFLLREYFAQPVVELGPATASAGGVVNVTKPQLVVFADFSSKACACFTKKWDRTYRKAFANDVSVEFRHAGVFDAAEEPSAGSWHGGPIAAALAAEAVRSVAGERAYQKVCRILFAHRKDLTHDTFDAAAAMVGLDEDEFLAEAASESVLQKVESDMALARRLGVRRPPTVFLDGRRVPDLCLKSKTFWDAVAATLNGRGEATASLSPVGG